MQIVHFIFYSGVDIKIARTQSRLHIHYINKNKMTNERNNLVEALRSVELIEGLNPTIYVRDDGDIVLSAEEFDGAANEYDYSIHPNIEAVMSKFGYVFGWETSGSLIAYKI